MYFLLFCSTPNEKLLGRLVKEKVCFQSDSLIECQKYECDMIQQWIT